MARSQFAISRASAEDVERLQDLIAANTLQTWFNAAALEAKVANAEERLNAIANISDIIKDQYLVGIGGIDDLDAANRDRAQTQAQVHALRFQLNNTKRQLLILLGRYPDANALTLSELPVLPAPLTLGVPTDVLVQRPDIRAAWQRVLASDAAAQVNYRSMLPNVSVNASLGHQDPSYSNLFDAPTVWSMLSQITAPLFTFGELRNETNAAEASAKQAYLNYLDTLLTALGEVESELDQANSLHLQYHAVSEALGYAQRAFENAQQDYQDGVGQILDLLAARVTLFDLQSQHIDLKAAQLSSRVNLALALGQGV